MTAIARAYALFIAVWEALVDAVRPILEPLARPLARLIETHDARQAAADLALAEQFDRAGMPDLAQLLRQAVASR